MNNNQDKINQLLARVDSLLERQESFTEEISALQQEVFKLKASEENETTQQERPKSINPIETLTSEAERTEAITSESDNKTQPASTTGSQATQPPFVKKTKSKSNLEKFIGENLINKIGIIITVIGVAIGAKYSIENDLISPLTRIVLGYLAGFGLLAVGLKLKKNYLNYSAVLVSGAMAIMYFITYAAYSFYGLVPQLLAFILMFVFTVFTVLAALNYNKQVIAHIGLVGAYAVPFLLSNDSGNVLVLFSYMSIINIGILIISFKKHWKPVFYASFALTWLIYCSWYFSDYNEIEHFLLALTFLSLFFAIFYITFLAYKLRQQQKIDSQDIVLLLANSFLYYGLGYLILNDHETGVQLLGLFTLFNALVHFAVSVLIFKRKMASKNLFFVIAGLVLVFITIAIPVQLDGNWVTLLWAGEAALLFWIGRTKQITTYEKISYALMVLAALSILHDWSEAYSSYLFHYSEYKLAPIFNVTFLTSVLFIVAFVFINKINATTIETSPISKKNLLRRIFMVVMPVILIAALYFSFRLEIEAYFDQLYAQSAIDINTNGNTYSENYWDDDLRKFKIIWVFNYTLLFLAIGTFLILKKLKKTIYRTVSLILNCLAIFAFLTQGLYVLSELRENYITQNLSEYYNIGVFNIGIRYVSFAFVAVLIFMTYRLIKESIKDKGLFKLLHLGLHICLLWILSSELLHWMDIAQSDQTYKLGLSILWGVYSLFLIILGIWKNKQYLRVAAMVLFGITLIKLFFYDISNLNTISKTIVFVSLGVLLLIISFLYNKFKNKISNEDESNN